jgi:hypothetical protein
MAAIELPESYEDAVAPEKGIFSFWRFKVFLGMNSATVAGSWKNQR